MLSSSSAAAAVVLTTSSGRAPLLYLPRTPRPTTAARIAAASDARARAGGGPRLLSSVVSWPRRDPAGRPVWVLVCRESSLQGPPGADRVAEEEENKKTEAVAAAAVARIASNSGGGDEGGSLRDWTTSVLIFGIWAGLMYYVFQLAPNQTPYRDTYFLQKLCNLKGDDGFRMNDVLVSLWYIMGLWPLLYSMLLLPTGLRYMPPALISVCSWPSHHFGPTMT